MQRQTVASGESYDAKLARIVQNIRLFLEGCRQSCFVLKEKTYLTTLQNGVSSLNFQDPSDQLLYNVIIDHCQKAERFAPGTFLHCLRLVLASLENPEADEPAMSSVHEATFRPTYVQLMSYIQGFLDNPFLSDVVEEVFTLAGVEGKVFVDRGTSDVPSVERVNGFTFPAVFPTGFTGTRHHVRCAVVDGVVESVSEVHHLLTHASETKEPLLFVCRGFSDDVIHTLKVNQARRTLDMIPVVVKYDFEGLNVLGDIAITCCSDVVSSMKGELISTLDFGALRTVPSVSCSGGSLTVVNDRALASAQAQVARLFEKRKDAGLEQFTKIYDDRIRSLTPSSVRVRVADDRSLQDYTEKLDVAFRLVRSAFTHGFISRRLMKTNVGLMEGFPDPVPTEVVVSAYLMSQRCKNALRQTAGVIA